MGLENERERGRGGGEGAHPDQDPLVFDVDIGDGEFVGERHLGSSMKVFNGAWNWRIDLRNNVHVGRRDLNGWGGSSAGSKYIFPDDGARVQISIDADRGSTSQLGKNIHVFLEAPIESDA